MHQTAYNSGVTAMNSFQFHDSGLSTANFTESYCYNPEYWSTAGVGAMSSTGYGVPQLNPMKQIEGRFSFSLSLQHVFKIDRNRRYF